MPFVPALTVRILTHERAHAGHQSMLDAVLAVVRRERLLGVTVTRAVEGYTLHGGLRTSTWADLADDLPLTIEIVDQVERIEQALPELTALALQSALTVTSLQLWVAQDASLPGTR